MHYQRWRNSGDPAKVGRAGPESRFWSKVELGDGCWKWTGARDSGGYGKFKVNGVQVAVHRFAYELLVGPIPEGFAVAHSCDVRHCVRREHLEVIGPEERFHRFVVAVEARYAV